MVVMTRIVTQSTQARPTNSAVRRRQCARRARVFTVQSAIASIESEKVRNTLMLYMTTRCRTLPRV